MSIFKVLRHSTKGSDMDRMSYLSAQNEYFKFFAYTPEGKADSILFEYRKKIRSEMQWVILTQIHYPFLFAGALYFITRQLKSGYVTAVFSASVLGAFVVHSIHNTCVRYPFELAYPAHPLIIERRKRAIEKWCYYDPQIIKYELEYLNKHVHKDGYEREFKDKSDNKYTISVNNSELYIDTHDKFEDIFEFRQTVLDENSLMDVLAPTEVSAHKSIIANIFEVYSDFSDEYLRQEYKPDTHHLKKALTKINNDFEIDKSVFDEDEDLLSRKDKKKKDLILKAYDEIEYEKKALDSNSKS